MQGRHEHGTLDGKAELARHQQAIQHLADAELLPQPREQQRTADPLSVERQAAVIPIERLQQQHLVGELGARGEQCGQCTGRDQRLGTAEIGNHRLAHGAANTAALDNLNVGTLPRLLDSEEHRSPPIRSTTISSFSTLIKPETGLYAALQIGDPALPPQLYQSLGSTSGRLTVQLGSRVARNRIYWYQNYKADERCCVYPAPR